MIDLLTGLPGNAKTLYVLKWVSEWAKKEGRQVYHSGIPFTEKGKDTLNWLEVEPTKWMECPPNSIIVIDEAQRIYRNRSINSTVPDYVAQLETHRHLGLDLVFITQHPMLIDPSVRRLTQRHRHMVRIHGFEASTIHEWNAVRENCDKPVARKDSEKTKWVFDSSFFDLYVSAQAHTFKRSLPKRLIWLLLAPLAIIAAVFAVKSLMFKGPPPVAPAAVQGTVSQGNQGGAVKASRAAFDPVADAREYAHMQQPRVQGLHFTAPKYDSVTQPTVVPVPAACVQSKKGCECYSQQATKLQTTLEQCLYIVENGWFQEFDPNGSTGKQGQGAAERQPASTALASVVR